MNFSQTGTIKSIVDNELHVEGRWEKGIRLELLYRACRTVAFSSTSADSKLALGTWKVALQPAFGHEREC